jgi:hypothetical protein
MNIPKARRLPPKIPFINKYILHYIFAKIPKRSGTTTRSEDSLDFEPWSSLYRILSLKIGKELPFRLKLVITIEGILEKLLGNGH